MLKTINKANFINMLSGKAMVEQGDEPAEKRSRVEKDEEEEEEEEEEEKEQKQSSWNILRCVQHCGLQAFFFRSATHSLSKSSNPNCILGMIMTLP